MSADTVIDLQGVNKTFNGPAGPIQALKNVSLKVYPGEFVGVRGPSGSGKSTLINMITDLVAFFDARGMKVGYSDVATEDRANASARFSILTQLLMMMTILMAVVGSMGLSGTLSINVIERRREIGVMRAVGASSRDVGFVFTGEGLMLGLTSWLFALPLGLGTAPAFVLTLGQVIEFPAEYYPATHGVWIWLGIVIVLSIFASWVPARRATRISVNESLAYE